MDVLELPRPVINFLRTMAKEGCRYVLSWDIFGGTDAITLTLTWKANDDQLELLKSPSEQVYDDLHIRHNDATVSPRRSRRDETPNTSAIFRSSRGKSLEDYNQLANRQIVYQPSQIASLERSSIINQPPKESDPIYANLCHVKYTANSTYSPLSVVSTHQRQTKQSGESIIHRKVTSATPVGNERYSKLQRINHILTRNDDDDTLDPWVKRLDRSLGSNTPTTVGKSDEETDKIGITSGKVKFKRKPDYF